MEHYDWLKDITFIWVESHDSNYKSRHPRKVMSIGMKCSNLTAAPGNVEYVLTKPVNERSKLVIVAKHYIIEQTNTIVNK